VLSRFGDDLDQARAAYAEMLRREPSDSWLAPANLELTSIGELEQMHTRDAAILAGGLPPPLRLAPEDLVRRAAASLGASPADIASAHRSPALADVRCLLSLLAAERLAIGPT